MIIVNPIGFLTLTIWNWGVYFNPTARRQYQARHNGHLPQISASDLAFSLHALVISSITLGQVIYYAWKNKQKSADDDESRPLLDHPSTAADLAIPTSTHKPSVPLRLLLAAMTTAALVSAGLVWTGKAEFLDWLYFISTLKLIITTVKYVPQALLNYRLESAEGLAIWVILLVS
jgi:cystinosin